MQIFGLILNLLGTILFGIGALDKSPPTWGDIQKESKKSVWINRLAWFGLIIIVVGFVIQILVII